jgi:hypothetical protein
MNETSANTTLQIEDIEKERQVIKLEREKLEFMRRELSMQKNIIALKELEDCSRIPKSLPGKLALAEQFGRSNLLPDAYKGKPDECFICLQFGEMLGFINPMACFQNIYVVNGKPSTSADSMLGLVMCQPEFLDYEQFIEKLTPSTLKARVNKAKKGDNNPNWVEIEVPNLKSISRITRKMPNGAEKIFERNHRTEMSIERFGVFPQWISDQENMLKHRSDGKVCRSAFPAITSGIHTPDELREYAEIEVQDGKGNITGKVKKDEIQENVVTSVSGNLFDTFQVKE